MLCASCRRALSAARPRPAEPVPRPAGMPQTAALGPYSGTLRSVLLEYKERGRHPIAGLLGERLAEAVVSALGPGVVAGVLVIPVPARAEAARRRHGDHMVRLARCAAAALRQRGIACRVAMPLRALPRRDSAGMTEMERRVAARDSFSVFPGAARAVNRAAAGGAVAILVDDIVTTGSTLAAAAATLRRAGVPIAGAAVLAVTRRWRSSRTVIV